jgi:cytochrome c oxidase subunit I+III
LASNVEEGRYYLPRTATGGRETIVTSAIDASPQYVLRLPMPGWPPVIAAVFTAAFFLLLTVKWVLPAAACGLIAVAAMLRWGWDLDSGTKLAPIDIGGGISLPAYASGPVSHTWWAAIVLILVIATTYVCLLFSYLYLWTVQPEVWPSADPPIGYAVIAAAACLLLSSAALGVANLALKRDNGMVLYAALGFGIALIAAAFALELSAHRGLDPSESSYAATVQTVVAFNGVTTLAVIVLALYALVRRARGLLDSERRNVFDNARLLWHYVVGQNLAGLALVHGFPRWVT